MENGEIEISNQEVLFSLNDTDLAPSGCSMESLFDEIVQDTTLAACIHTCSPPGPDLSHTHTCFHVHTKIISAPADGAVVEEGQSKPPLRQQGDGSKVPREDEGEGGVPRGRACATEGDEPTADEEVARGRRLWRRKS